jgi:hypothetical protein
LPGGSTVIFAPLNSGPTRLPQLRLAHAAAAPTSPVLSGATANSPLLLLTHIAADGSVLYIQIKVEFGPGFQPSDVDFEQLRIAAPASACSAACTARRIVSGYFNTDLQRRRRVQSPCHIEASCGHGNVGRQLSVGRPPPFLR